MLRWLLACPHMFGEICIMHSGSTQLGMVYALKKNNKDSDVDLHPLRHFNLSLLHRSGFLEKRCCFHEK